MEFIKWHSNLTERIRLALGWSYYAMYWLGFIKSCVNLITSLIDELKYLTIPTVEQCI